MTKTEGYKERRMHLYMPTEDRCLKSSRPLIRDGCWTMWMAGMGVQSPLAYQRCLLTGGGEAVQM